MKDPLGDIVGPASHFYVSQRLRLHYLDWGNDGKPTLVLVHGGRDHAHSWDWVARRLRADYHVVAPDLRGHGDSAWAIGGMYALSDFVLDLAQLLEAIGAFPVTIVSHSLGGMVSLQYAGLYPERVEKLVAIEGLGPPPAMLAEWSERAIDERLRRWIADMQGLAARAPKRYPSVEEAANRMQEVNSFLSEEQARHLTIHGVARNEDGSYSWKFDNYVRTGPPFRFDVEEVHELWGRITCPTLLLRGTESWASDPLVDGRMAAFRNAKARNFEGAGHWVHHDRLEEFLEVVQEFLRR
ncbi:MAG TPA: alpha/beta hydrolase [Thermoanaerobaculia bacterium]|nr:alpha/beta hydrolase [Thermoanaerobaculia bacterium]